MSTRDDRTLERRVLAPRTEGAMTVAATRPYPACLTLASHVVEAVRSYGPASRVVRTQKMQAARA